VPDEQARTLGELVTRCRQLVDMLTAEQNRRRLLRDRGLQHAIEAHIAWFEDAIERLEADLATVIRSTPIWREADELLRSVPGAGPVTSCMVIADLPELGHLDRRRIAALAGLAPVARDSGAFRGRRMIVGGRAHIRHSLYMATVAASTIP
jgi:transposase